MAECEICGTEYGELLEHKMYPADGKCIHGCGQLMAQASVTIGGTTTYYETLDEAIQAVSSCTAGDNAAVKLHSSLMLTETVTISSGVFTLDLNGKDVTFSEAVSFGFDISGEVTFAGTGTVTMENGNAIYVQKDAAVTISGGTYDGTVALFNAGTANVSGGTLKGSSCGIRNLGALTIAGGEVSSYQKNTTIGYHLAAVYSLDGSTTVTGGTLKAGRFGMIQYGDGTVDLSDFPGAEGVTIWSDDAPTAEMDATDVILPDGFGLFDDEGNQQLGAIAQGIMLTVDWIHVHNWSYTAQGDTITETCNSTIGKCPNPEQTITICADGKTYDGKPVTANLTGSIEGMDTPANTYSGNTNAGTYTASIKLDKATAAVEFTIEKATPTVAWADTSASVDYTGSAAVITAPTVTLVNGETFDGDISYSYTGTSSGNGLPTNAGTYEITASIDAQGNYTAATSTNKLTLTINKAPSSVTKAPEAISGLKFQEANGKEVQQNLITAGEAAGGTMVYRLSSSDEWSERIPTAGQARNYTVYYKVLGDSNHNDSAEGQVNVSIAKADAPTVTIPEQEHFYTIPTTGNRIDIKSLLPNLCVFITNQSGVTGTTGDFITNAVLNNGILTYDTDAASAPVSGTITVKIVMQHYADVIVTVNVKLVDLNPVNNSGTDAEIKYDGSTYDVAQMFTRDTNAGEASYAITGGTGAGTLSGSELTITKAGTIEITMTTEANGNYAAGEAAAALTVKKGNYDITVSIEGWTYGDRPNAPTFDGPGEVTYTYDNETGAYRGTEPPTDAGMWVVVATYTGNDLYNRGYAYTWFTIAKKALTITAENNTITYGDAPAADGVTASGFVSGEDFADLSGTLTYSFSYERYGDAGNYAITPGGLMSSNYEITYVPGVLTVSPKAITVTANPISKVYGDEDPSLTYAVSGMVNGDKITGALKRDEGEVPGTYAIGQNTLSADDNYTLTFTGADFIITPKAITAEDVKLSGSLVYNGKKQTQPITVTEGIAYTVTGNTGTDVGTYTQTVKATGNYTGEVKLDWIIAECTHSGNTNVDDDNCATAVTCSVCQAVLVEAKDHCFTTKATDKLVTEADCTNAATYFVRCDECAQISGTVTVSVGEPLGHAWTVTYTWTEDGKVCTALHACGNDAKHNETAKAVITSAVKTEPGCTSLGETTYTAVFDAEWAETQIKDVFDIPVVGHNHKPVVMKSTCTEQGYTIHICHCGNKYMTDYTAPIGHRYDDEWDKECNNCGQFRKIETVPMYRMYNPNTGEHFYTGSVEERENLVAVGWNYEGVAWNSASENDVPQYRLYNPNAEVGAHHYTTSEEERDHLIGLDWIYEGIGWYGTIY